ncbi:hypothetical protein GEV33_013447 [Tenebrio molitor]|uniref:Uncharacterized protein n=1 Tax=Tenebrio molitor TaxID=7067 RepID=A0A8J6L6H8_TENMO|nr:hypothetical protein GEV33_013447 [Tenebrio molitor]
MIWAVVEAFGLFNRGYNFVTIMELNPIGVLRGTAAADLMALAFVYDESFDGGIAEKPPSRVPKSSKGFARVSIFSLSWVLGSSWGSEILLYGSSGTCARRAVFPYPPRRKIGLEGQKAYKGGTSATKRETKGDSHDRLSGVRCWRARGGSKFWLEKLSSKEIVLEQYRRCGFVTSTTKTQSAILANFFHIDIFIGLRVTSDPRNCKLFLFTAQALFFFLVLYNSRSRDFVVFCHTSRVSEGKVMEREIQVHQVQSLKIFLLCIAEEDSGAKDETQSLAEDERGRSVGRVWSAVVTGGPAERPEFAVREDEVRKEILLRGGRSRLAVAPDVGVVVAWEPDLESPRRIWAPQTRRSCWRRTGRSCRQGPPGARTGGRKNQGRVNLEKTLRVLVTPLPHLRWGTGNSGETKRKSRRRGGRKGERRSLGVANILAPEKTPKSFGRLVGSAAGHFRDGYITVRLAVEERTVARSTPGGDKDIGSRGANVLVQTSVVKVQDPEDGSVVVGVVEGRSLNGRGTRRHSAVADLEPHARKTGVVERRVADLRAGGRLGERRSLGVATTPWHQKRPQKVSGGWLESEAGHDTRIFLSRSGSESERTTGRAMISTETTRQRSPRRNVGLLWTRLDAWAETPRWRSLPRVNLVRKTRKMSIWTTGSSVIEELGRTLSKARAKNRPRFFFTELDVPIKNNSQIGFRLDSQIARLSFIADALSSGHLFLRVPFGSHSSCLQISWIRDPKERVDLVSDIVCLCVVMAHEKVAASAVRWRVKGCHGGCLGLVRPVGDGSVAQGVLSAWHHGSSRTTSDHNASSTSIREEAVVWRRGSCDGRDTTVSGLPHLRRSGPRVTQKLDVVLLLIQVVLFHVHGVYLPNSFRLSTTHYEFSDLLGMLKRKI